jgi:beta-galactosidase
MEKSQGSKALPAGARPRSWRVLFEPGTIEAACRHGVREYGLRDQLHTAGKAARIVLSTGSTPLMSDWDRVSYVTATVTDDQGILVPSANNQIAFQIEGSGVTAAMDNADNASHEPFQAS